MTDGEKEPLSMSDHELWSELWWCRAQPAQGEAWKARAELISAEFKRRTEGRRLGVRGWRTAEGDRKAAAYVAEADAFLSACEAASRLIVPKALEASSATLAATVRGEVEARIGALEASLLPEADRARRLREFHAGWYVPLEQQRAAAVGELRAARRTAAAEALAALPSAGSAPRWSKAWLDAAMSAAQSLGAHEARPVALALLVDFISEALSTSEIELGLTPLAPLSPEEEQEAELDEAMEGLDVEPGSVIIGGGGEA